MSGGEQQLSVKKNFLYNLAYQVLTIVLPLVTAPYLSRVLGAEGVGTYSWTYSVAYYFVLFAMLGTTNYGQRQIACCRDDREAMSRTFWSIWALQFGLSLVVVLAYIVYLLVLSDSPAFAAAWMPYVLSSGLDVNWLFFGREEFKVTVTRNFIVKLATICLMFLVVRGDNALLAYLLLMSCSYLLSVAALWPLVLKRVDFRCPRFFEVIGHVRPNLLLFLPVIAVSLYTVLDKVMLGAISGMTEEGYFENALKIATMPMAFIEALGVVMLPHMSNLIAKGKDEQMVEYLGGAMWFSMMFAFAFAFGIAGTAPVLVPVFFGEGFEPCALLLCVIVTDLPFMAWASVLRKQYLIPSARDRTFVASVVCGAVVNLMLNVLLMPSLGAFGASVAIAAAEITVCAVQVWAVRGELPQGRWALGCGPYLVIGTVMLVVVRAVGTCAGATITSLAVQVITGVVVYAGLTWAWCKLSHDQYYEAFALPAIRNFLAKLQFVRKLTK